MPFLYLQISSTWKGYIILQGSCSSGNVAENWKNQKIILVEKREGILKNLGIT